MLVGLGRSIYHKKEHDGHFSRYEADLDVRTFTKPDIPISDFVSMITVSRIVAYFRGITI